MSASATRDWQLLYMIGSFSMVGARGSRKRLDLAELMYVKWQACRVELPRMVECTLLEGWCACIPQVSGHEGQLAAFKAFEGHRVSVVEGVVQPIELLGRPPNLRLVSLAETNGKFKLVPEGSREHTPRWLWTSTLRREPWV